MSKTEFKLSGFDKVIWRGLVEEHSNEGYSVKVAQLFDIDFTKFPCLLIFQDIRSPDHVIVKLEGMTAEEIAERMRSIFSIIQKAVADKSNPLQAVLNHQNSETFHKTGRTIISKVSGFAEKTFETAIEAWINAVIK